MKNISNRSKVIYLILLIIFISGFGLFWMDYIGLVNLKKYSRSLKSDASLVVNAGDDEPSLIEKEEFNKEKQKLLERVEALNKREILISEKEKELDAKSEKFEEIKKGLELEKRKFENDKKKYSGYKKNVKKLADKIANMPPDDSVKIMINWEDPLIIDVLRQMDADAIEQGKVSITAYLITLMPKKKASMIMYLMTQL